MTVRAAHLTLADFGLEPREARSTTSEVRDVSGLLANMVEVENNQVTLIAIDTAGRLKHGEDVTQVPDLVREQGRWWWGVRVRPPPSGAPSGSPAVAVRADDFALRDLLQDRRSGGGGGAQPAHGRALVTQVVELEDVGVREAAVGTRMRLELTLDQRVCLVAPAALRGFHLRQVPLTASPKVRSKAFAAPPLAVVCASVERARRQRFATAAARSERCQVGWRFRLSSYFVRGGPVDVSGPRAYRGN